MTRDRRPTPLGGGPGLGWWWLMPAQRTGIVWTDWPITTWRGCATLSEGCRHCWAAALADRFDRTPEPRTVATIEDTPVGSDTEPEPDVAVLLKHHSGPVAAATRQLTLGDWRPRECIEFPPTPAGVPDAPQAFLPHQRGTER